jgi:transposase
MARMTLMLEAHCIEVLQSCQTLSAAERLLGLSDHELGAVRNRAVERGLARRQHAQLTKGGLDEKSFLRGQSFVTVLSDLLRGCVLEVTQDRTQESAELALQSIPLESRAQVEAMAMDMHKPFQHAVEKLLPQAAIVHDRYHIKSHLNDAVNKVRRAEHKELCSQGDKSLSGTRYIFLKNPGRLTETQSLTFEQLASMQLKVTRAWGLKELFDNLYSYRSEGWALNFFDKWFYRATHSRLPSMVKVAWMLKRHVGNIVTYAKHQITNAVAEGLNSKIQILKSAARGFRSFHNYRIAILFHCGNLDMLPSF